MHHYLRQSVTLTGYGTTTFERGIQAILDVQAFFDRNIPANKLDECTLIEKCDGALGINMTNQYFTPWREATNEVEVTFTSDIDPMGILAGHGKNQFIHCEQNVVKYYNRKTIQGGAIKLVLIRIFEQTNTEYAIRYEAIPPVRFHVGDIVEIKATLMLIPVREGHFKLTAVLRSLTLLDTSFTKVCAITASQHILITVDGKTLGTHATCIKCPDKETYAIKESSQAFNHI